jgi:Fe-S cluster assembly protein SufD
MTRLTLEDRFAATLDTLPGSSSVRSAREDAMSCFSKVGFPTRKLENWRYTDMSSLASSDYDPARSPPDTALIESSKTALPSLGLSGNAVVFLDGVPQAGLREWPRSKGVPLAALNTAFGRDGISISVADGYRIPEPIPIVLLTSDRTGNAPQPRIVIKMGEASEASLILHLKGNEETSAWTNLVTQVDLQARSKLAIHRVQELGLSDIHTELLSARVRDAATLEASYVDLGGQLVRNDVHVDLVRPEAECDLYGVFLADKGQHIDNHLRVDHSAPRTVSNESFKGIAGERGRGVFNGKVVVHKDAQKIDATQSSDNLLLSEHAEIDTKPELEIYADDVKCSHGATVGQLDERQLFYLRARGIPEPAARGLLIFAFANEVIQRLPTGETRDRVARRVWDRLPGELDWDVLL